MYPLTAVVAVVALRRNTRRMLRDLSDDKRKSNLSRVLLVPASYAEIGFT